MNKAVFELDSFLRLKVTGLVYNFMLSDCDMSEFLQILIYDYYLIDQA